MTVPVQRGPESDGTGRVLGFVAESLRRLEDSVGRLSSDVNVQLSRLPDLYVSRREFDRWRDDLTVDVGALQARADAAAKAREERERDDARDRATARRWLIGVLLTIVSLLIGLTGLVLTNI